MYIKRNKKKTGFVSIPLVLGLASLIIALGLLSATTSFNHAFTSATLSDASKASFYAESAFRDVAKRISEDHTYNPPPVEDPYTYTVNFDDATVTVRVETEQEIPSPRIVTITVNHKDIIRKIQYDIGVDGNGQSISIKRREIRKLHTASTAAPTNIESNSATLNGWSNPNDNASGKTAWFRYDTTNPGVCDDSFGTASNTGSVGSGMDPLPFQESGTTGIDISGLSSDTVYYYCAIASDGTNKVYGNIWVFVTSE